VKAAKTTAAQGRNVAERAALVYVGATLEARDRALGLVNGIADRFGSRTAAERELNKDLRRFERRGNTARNKLERDVRKARTRLERVVRTRRREAERLLRRNTRAVERQVSATERQAARRPNIVAARINDVSNRVEDVAQVGVVAAERLASVAKERVTALV
jgi:biopolymer transport protein ExbB/TolQ